MDHSPRLGSLLFGIGVAALGAENLILARSSATEIAAAREPLSVLPFLPPIAPIAIAVGTIFLLAGCAFIARARLRIAVPTLALALAGALFAVQIPRAAAAPIDLGTASLFETVSLIAAAAMLFPGPARADSAVRAAGRWLLAVSLIVFGAAHLLVPNLIASLIPGWIPAHLFFAWFTGLAMIAAGLGIALRKAAPLASLLMALMFAIIFTTVHVPRVCRASRDPDEWSSAFICFAMVGASLICARITSGKAAA